jgi:hypothetical protein
MIHNKSSHPIEIKRILVRIWSLRDEIEAAISRRISECESSGIPLFVDDIKNFYGISESTPLTQAEVIPLREPEGSINDTMANLAMDSEENAEKEEAPKTEENQNALNQAENILATQTKENPEVPVEKNPIIDRPFVRQAPDLAKISYGFSMLSDIHMEETLVFSKHHFIMGQTVVVEFLIPNSFMMTAEVRVCNFIALKSKVISETKPNYRLQNRFNFHFAGERTNLRNFLLSIQPDLPASKPKKSDAPEESVEI